jgi:pullulanase
MLFVYGEGWTAGDSPLPEGLRAVKKNGLQLPRIAVFSDDLRDAVKGSWNDAKKGGFACGVGGLEESVKFGIAGATKHSGVNYNKVNYSKAPYANHPGEVINYVSCHDDLCLNDKLRLASGPNTTEEELIRMNKLAQTMVFTSQGVPFIYAGEEIFRSKREIHNTFDSPDSINQINWDNKSRYAGLFDYYRQLIALRKAHPAFRMTRTEDVERNLRFMNVATPCVVGFTLNNHANGDTWKEIVVIFNGNKTDKVVDIPAGKWQIAAADGRIDPEGKETLDGGKVIVKGISALIVFRK